MAKRQQYNGWVGYGGFMRRPGEYTNVSENQGGLISQFLLILAQTVGLALLSGLAIAVVLFSLWSLPSEFWWVVLTTVYATAIFLAGVIPYTGINVTLKGKTIAFEGLCHKLDGWGRVGYVVGFSLIAAFAAWGFDQWLWDPLDRFTQWFFRVKVPVLNGLALAAAAFTVIALLLLAAKKLWTVKVLAVWVGSVLAALGLWYVALGTAEWERPTLHFYLFMLPINAASVYALVQGAVRMGHDLYWPTWGSLPMPEGEDNENFMEKQYTFIDSPANRHNNGPLEDSGTITKVAGPNGERWLICQTNLEYFIGLLPVRGITQRSWMEKKLPAGLVMYDRNGKPVFKNRPMTQWEHWAPYAHFLREMGIHDGSKIDVMYLDADGKPDVEAILAHLKLNGYEEIDETD